jgi:hypothetical protein
MKFMGKLSDIRKFSFPEKDDIRERGKDAIILKLSRSIASGMAIRAQALKPFGTHFPSFNEK